MKGETHIGNTRPIMPWMINFECPKRKCYKQERAINAANQLEYKANLSINSKCSNYLLTGLSCSLGPTNINSRFITEILRENIRFVSIDTSKGTEIEHLKLLDAIRDCVQAYNEETGRPYPFAIAVELTGLRIRTGNVDSDNLSDLLLEENHIVYVTVNDNYECHCNKNVIYVNYRAILYFVSPSNLIYIDYGSIILEVLTVAKAAEKIKCKVINGGKLRDKAIIHLPHVPQNISEEIKAELVSFALKNEVDAIILCRVNDGHKVESVRNLLGPEGNATLIIAKIEDAIAIENIDQIIKVADGIIIARGELGMEIPPQKLFLAQKAIIAKCNKAGKPVICTGHFLKSMHKNLLPSRAEMIDVANTILDGADGILISEDIVNSQNIFAAIHSLQNICMESETAIYQKELMSNLITALPTQSEPVYSVALSAVEASLKCNAACIIVQTVSGRSAKLIAQYRPLCPIIVVTRYGHVARTLNFWRGIIPIHFCARPRSKYLKEIEARFQYGVTFGKYAGLIRGGDTLILVSGWKELSGFTNTIRIVYASQNDCKMVESKPCD